MTQVTSLYRLRREAGPWLEPSSLLGFLPRQPSVTGPGFVRGVRRLEAGVGTSAIGTLDALILFGNKLKSSIIPPPPRSASMTRNKICRRFPPSYSRSVCACMSGRPTAGSNSHSPLSPFQAQMLSR